MKDDVEFAYKVRQILNHGTDTLDVKVAERLHLARTTAIQSRGSIQLLRFAGVANIAGEYLSGYLRVLLTLIALSVGVIGTYYWNSFEQASEFEEIDSALLADELPPAIYLDRGFHAWLEHNSQDELH